MKMKGKGRKWGGGGGGAGAEQTVRTGGVGAPLVCWGKTPQLHY